MDWTRTKARFAFLRDAFEGDGGFAPCVEWHAGTDGKQTPMVKGPSYLIPHARESAEKYAARCAVATYENHLREAAERFVGYLGRKKPARNGTDAPLVGLLMEDCDLRGTKLDAFLSALALDAKARGSMLLLLDMPPLDAFIGPPVSMADQIARRQVPFLRPIAPELVTDFTADPQGQLTSVSIDDVAKVDGQWKNVVRTWDAQGWQIKLKDQVVDQGAHPFGQCPVLVLTESCKPFPVLGKYAQIADLSKRLYNARSERDEILRGQTFSLLTFQIPPENVDQLAALTGNASATIGTHSMLVHTGETPAFIAPDSGPAEVYANTIKELEESIRRIGQDITASESSQLESGVSRRLRFEALNADLSTFGTGMQGLELRMWELFHRAIGTTNRVTSTWPTDYNLTDTQAELDILASMQGTLFPEVVLAEKKRAIVAAEFDNADEATKQDMLKAIEQQAQQPPTPVKPGLRAVA